MSGESLFLSDVRIDIAGRLEVYVPQLSLPAGRIGILLGPNGSGKSTLARYICRVQGVERVNAEEERRPVPPAVMVWQNLNLFPLTVKKNVFIVGRGNAETGMKFFNLWILRDSPVESLSGGERQKLAILRSLVVGADMMVLDEPTSSLDGQSIEQLVSVLASYTGNQVESEHEFVRALRTSEERSSQRSILIVTHDLRLVRALSRVPALRVFTLAENLEKKYGQAGYRLNSGEMGEGYSIEEVHKSPPDLFSADFFGIPNVIGFTSAAGPPRSPEDFCSRYLQEAVGWVVLRDEAIRVRPSDGDGIGGSEWKGRVMGWEYIGPVKRVRIAIKGRHGEFPITVPNWEVGDVGEDVAVEFNLADPEAWAVVEP